MDNILEQCNGTIKDGMCTKCFDRARNTSAICTNLYNPAPSPSQVLAAEAKEIECPFCECRVFDRIELKNHLIYDCIKE